MRLDSWAVLRLIRFHSSKERKPSSVGGVSGVSDRIEIAVSVKSGVWDDEELISVAILALDDAVEELDGESTPGPAETGCGWTAVSTLPNENQ